MQKILVIQTAFIGDVVLATALVEKLAKFFPEADIDFLVRKGNENIKTIRILMKYLYGIKKKIKQEPAENAFSSSVKRNTIYWLIRSDFLPQAYSPLFRAPNKLLVLIKIL
ncbi:MAG: hypothetical protein R2765_04235 [Ferruginibacter sp.]